MGTTHLSGLEVAGVPTMGINGAPLFTGNWFFVDAVNGNDANTGAADSPLATVYVAYSKTVSGHNDVVVVVGSGSTAGTQRLSVANAQIATPAATVGTLTWANNATHLIGMTAPTQVSQRARFAPPTGVYTQATFGSGNFIVASGQGCYFGNFSIFNGFSTGGSNQIAWTDSGGRNFYYNVDFGGAGDAASAQSTSSRSLLVTGSTGENTFINCNFGLDTVQKTVANATLSFAAGSPRNVFRGCNFAMLTSSASSVHIDVPAGGIDRYALLDNCFFSNAVESTSTTLNAAITANAAAGGAVVLNNPVSLGATALATTGPVYVQGAVPVATTSGIAIKAT